MDIMKDNIPDIDLLSRKGMPMDLGKHYFSETRQQIPLTKLKNLS